MTTAIATPPPTPSSTTWSYDEAFSRHDGLLSPDEQQKLRRAHVAIAGLGGVGGVHLITLARLGIGNFTIADPDEFELANFNRQFGANLHTLGRGKAEVMAEQARAINPEANIRVIADRVHDGNVEEFLADADVFVDGLDFFCIDARRTVFAAARQRGIWSVTAGPHAFSTAWLIFSPTGMSFDRFFDLDDSMTEDEKTVAFAVGCVPSPLHLAYLDLSKFFKPEQKKGASLGLACQLASGIVGAEVAKIVLGRAGVRPAPWYFQFDAHRQMFKKGRLRGGNRHPWQRAKRWWISKKMNR